MKHLQNFTSYSEYENFLTSAEEPHISYIENSQNPNLDSKAILYSEDYDTPFYIEAIEDLTVTVGVDMNYSIDGQEFNILTANTASPTVKAGQKIYLIIVTGSTGANTTFTITNKCKIGGELDTLRTPSGGKPTRWAFPKFEGQPIVDASRLKMPQYTVEVSVASMFANCKLLKYPPKKIYDCRICSNMFYGCESLLYGPELGNNWEYCKYMFYNCKSLIKAPKLGWTYTIKTSGAAQYMFYGCENLSFIHSTHEAKSLATDIFKNWTWGVSPTGTFVASANNLSLSTGTNNIPEGWTIELDGGGADYCFIDGIKLYFRNGETWETFSARNRNRFKNDGTKICYLDDTKYVSLDSTAVLPTDTITSGASYVSVAVETETTEE